jgi:DNA-binding protein HU-beta
MTWHGARGPENRRIPDAPEPCLSEERLRAAPAGDAATGEGTGPVPRPDTCHRIYERNPVNKSELVSAIAKRADVPASTVDSVLAGLQDELVEAITRGEKVAVSGLLTVERTQRSARTGRNPQTGESIDIPAANTVKVTAGSNLKKAASSVPV